MANFFDDIADSYVFDLPGFGQSPTPPETWGTEDYAKALNSWLNENNIEKAIFIGHSFGCRVALRLAAQNPEKVAGLSLIAAAGLKRKRSLYFKIRASLLELTSRLAGLSDKVFKTSLKARFASRFGSKDYRNSGDLRSVFVRTINEDLTETAKKVTCPTLLVFGENDDQTPPEFGLRYKSLLKDAELIILPNHDHYSVLAGGRHPVQAALKRFMEKLNS